LNSLKKELLYLALGEFAALCTFIFVYRSLSTYPKTSAQRKQIQAQAKWSMAS